jgi:hypothetical protein
MYKKGEKRKIQGVLEKLIFGISLPLNATPNNKTF